ncbi:hypothetical protein [Lentzea sp. CA-135723]|uniref:hypothetical protein n=1 Tax=Lentzea sp. CA-135723 TaxID=3239950 RepID=UPI003D909639
MDAIIAAQDVGVSAAVPLVHLQVLDKETLQALDGVFLLYDAELDDDALLRTAHAELLLAQATGQRVLGSTAPISTDAPASNDEVVLEVAA